MQFSTLGGHCNCTIVREKVQTTHDNSKPKCAKIILNPAYSL